jgi:regulator of replication initiation timing
MPTRAKRPTPMQRRIEALTEECEQLRRRTKHLEQTQVTFVEHARTLTIERNNLRRNQLLAKLTVADHDAVRNAIATIRAAQAEINSRLEAISALFEIETKTTKTEPKTDE